MISVGRDEHDHVTEKSLLATDEREGLRVLDAFCDDSAAFGKHVVKLVLTVCLVSHFEIG
jgi:hypothetical protein